MFRRISVALFAFVTCSVLAVSGTLPGRDAYAVHIASSNTTLVVERPKQGTFYTQTILVKTKVAQGKMYGGEGFLSSPLNAQLSTVRPTNIVSAFTGVENAEGREIGLDRVYEIHYTEGIEPFDLCARLMDNPEVEYAVPVMKHNLFFTPNDPRFNQQAWASNIKLSNAWDIAKGSAEVIIAIIDSGTDWQHQDLSVKIWSNTKETANGIDDDGNGFVDDIRGWDFVGNITAAEAQQGVFKPDNDPRVSGAINDISAHGTATAGCAAAATNNSIGIAGAGFNCTIMPIKCGSDNSSLRSILRGYEAIIYAANNGADIINCSWGGPGIDPSAQDVINFALSKGALVVAASGNDGMNNDSYLQSPASLENVLAVGSTSNSNTASGFSNYGWNVDVYAPGENTITTYPNNGYSSPSGTSFSCPITAGVAGLIKALHPTWTPQQIAMQLRVTCDEISGVSSGNRPLFYGRINAEKAIKSNSAFTGTAAVPGIISKGIQISGSGSINSYAPTTVSFSLENILGDASNVTATIMALPKEITSSGGSSVFVGAMKNGESKTAQFIFQLASTYPWYKESFELQLEIRTQASVDYIKVIIPVNLPTENVFTNITQLATGVLDINHVSYTSDGVIWAPGTFAQTPALVRTGNVSDAGLIPTPFSNPTAFAAQSSSQALAGVINNGSATVYRTTDGGSSWAQSNVSSITTSISGIKMFSTTTGILVGNGANGRIGVARTTNSGTTWSAVATAPTLLNAERAVDGSFFSLGDTVWFASTSNRVFSSTDKGATWKISNIGVNGAQIHCIAFRDNDNGMVLYRTSAALDSPRFIATTTNGGLNWSAKAVDASKLSFVPVKLYSPGGHHLAVGSEGQMLASEDNGATWKIVLSQRASTTSTMVVTPASQGRFLAVTGGSNVCTLQYRFVSSNGSKLPAFVASVTDFGTLNLAQSRLRSAQIRNTGTADVTIDSVIITPDSGTPAGAFEIATSPRTTIATDGTLTISLRCTASPTIAGSYSATLSVYSNGTPSVITTRLTALIINPSSISELNQCSTPLFPNPATTTITFPGAERATVNIYSNSGQLMLTALATPQVDISLLSNGYYTAVITSDTGVQSYRFTVLK